MSSRTDLKTDREPGPGLRAWLGLAVLTLPIALLGIDMTVLHFAVPELSADLAPTAPQLLWIVDIYGFLIVGFLITMGTLGDRVGRRRLLLLGTAAFGVASVLAAFATSAAMLIAARALLGAAAATLMPSTLSLLRVMFENPRHRTVAVSVWSTGFMGGSALGPVVGGAMLEHYWWGSVFLLGVPVMLLLLVTGPILLPEYRNPAPERLDLTSALLLLVSLLATVYALKEIVAGSVGVVQLLVLVAGVAVGTVFLRRQRVLTSPLLDLTLFTRRRFSTSLVVVLLCAMVFAGMQFLIAQFLQTVLGLSPLNAGLWTLPATFATIVSTVASGRMVRRTPAPTVMVGSLMVVALGMSVLAVTGPDYVLATVLVGFLLISIGTGPIMALAADLATSTAPPEKTGTAAGVMETTSELGIALGIAMVGSLGAAVYRREITGGIPAGTPEAAADAASSTIGAASTVAAQLPPALGEPLLQVAHHAFARGLQVSATAGAVLLVVVALGAYRVFRRAETPRSAPVADRSRGRR